MSSPNGQRPSLGLVAGLAAVVLIAGGSTAWLTWRSTAPTPPVGVISPTQPENKLTLYWLKADQNSLELAPITIQLTALSEPTTNPELLLKAGIERLLSGPANADVSTTIPVGTKVNALSLQSDGIHLDLSPEFLSGGGSLSMQGRLGQIIYTASSLNPEAKIWLSVAGEPLKVLGGEGLEVQQPITRQMFDQDFPLSSKGVEVK
jgi:spore germination protein GerM